MLCLYIIRPSLRKGIRILNVTRSVVTHLFDIKCAHKSVTGCLMSF